MNKVLKFSGVIIIILVCIILYARFVGTLGFDTKEYTIVHEDMPSGFDGLKIVHFSDIHYNRAIDLDKLKKIVKEINLINPDMVVFTGDLIEQDMNIEDSHYSDLINVLSKIDAKYGKYAVLGNHDYSKMDKVIGVFNDSGFKYLENSYDIIYNEKKEKIFIGGIGNVTYNIDDISKMMNYFEKNEDIEYKIILVHEPDITDNIVNDYSVDLILAGHSHNGQVRLPVIGAIYTPPHSKNYYDNYYTVNGTDLYISSGIGVSTVNYRLWNRPSLNFYRINKS